MTTGSVIEDLVEIKVQQSSSMCYNMAAIKKNYWTYTHFQYLSARFTLLTITTHETDTQKW